MHADERCRCPVRPDVQRFGHEPVLFEQAPGPRTGGYVIDFWGIGYDVADRMGLVPALLELGYRVGEWPLVDSAIKETPASVRIAFDRGEPRDFDLVVGADGLHSRVRGLVFGPEEREQGLR